MKEISLFGLMVGFVIFGAGSESVLAQTTIAVPARSFCVDSGINVSRGDSLQFSASGQGSYGYEGSPVNSTPLTNPDGDRFVNGVNIGKKDDPNAIYKGFIGGLVGKVGTNGNYFFIGSNNQLSMGQSGRLFLCYNDVANSFNNNTGGYRVSINRISDPNQQNTAERSPSPSQQRQIGRSPQISQNINQFNRFEIGNLSTGERVLRVSREVMLQSPFREAIRRPIRNSATEIDRPIDGIFVWDGSQLLFAGYDVESISGFKVGNQSYWVTRVRTQDGSGKVEVSQPKFVSSKVANINTSNYQFIRQFKQDYTINGFFYVTIANGNGLYVETITYLVDLRIAAANPNQNVVVCESSRYKELRNGNSTTKENPDCRTGQQVMARRSPSPNQQNTTGRSPASNQQTATRTVQPVRQTFSSVKSLGMAQFLWESTELKSAQETLHKAAIGEYNTITNGQKIDFFEEGITEIRPVDCRSFGFSCESKEITYADYLNLKLKVYLQIGVFKNGMKVYDQISKYQNRLFQDRQYGGLNVGQNLTSEWEKRWNNVKEQQRLKDKQANLPITERLGVVMEQTIKDTANFSVELFKTSTKVAATLAQIKDLADTITSLTSINQYNLNRISGGPKYTIAAVKILTDAGKALQSFDTDKLNELTLKAAQETIELINAQDRKVAGSANVIKIYFAAKDIIDKNKLLRQPQATNALDEFDRFYIAAAMYSKAVDVIIGGLSIPFSEAKVVDTLLKKADAVNTVLFEALEFTYKDTVRRQYVRLQYAYNRNQIQVVGLSSFIDYAAEEVGNYLLKARPDIVTRRPDGTIAVTVDSVVYPP